MIFMSDFVFDAFFERFVFARSFFHSLKKMLIGN